MGHGHFGENLRRVRQARKLTQAGLGRLAGVDRVTVARHESGVMQPLLATIDTYARALGVSRAALLGFARRPSDAPPARPPSPRQRLASSG